MTSTAVAPMQAFQERVKEKLKADIGQLLPDEVVSEMVQRVIAEEFFTKKTIRNNPQSYNDTSTREEPSVFQHMVIEAAKPLVAEAASKVFEENRRRMQKQIDEAVQSGLLKMALHYLDTAIVTAFQKQPWELQSAVQSALRNMPR